jgi:magnesium transporter
MATTKHVKNYIRTQSRQKEKTGSSPGTLIYTGEKRREDVSINIMSYNEKGYTEKVCDVEDNYLKNLPPDNITWINVDGLHEVNVIEKFGEFFNLHPLVLEDILNVNQLPKVDEYQENDIIYITLNEFYFDDGKHNSLDRDQISLVLGKNFLITFQEEEGDYFEAIRDRLRNSKGRIRARGADYLAYTLIDAIVDSYYIVLDKYSERLETIENEIFVSKNEDHVETIHHINKDLIFFRRAIAPLKEVIYQLLKQDIILIQPSSKAFLRDLLDHANQIISQIDVDREFISDLIQTNMTNLNSRLNEIIKVLTLISTIFIPLTFIVGVYGMNFDIFPELHWKYGYFTVWAVMIIITAIQIIIFKKNKWI